MARHSSIRLLSIIVALALPSLAAAAAAPSSMQRRTVTFVGPIQAAWRQELADHGIVVRAYVPPHAFAVLADPAAQRWLSEQAFVARVAAPASPAGSSRRVVDAASAPGVAAAAAAAAAAAPVPYALRLRNADDAAAVRALLEKGGMGLLPAPVGQLPSETILEAQMTASQAALLAADLRIEAVEPGERVHVFNDMAYGLVQSGVLHNGSFFDHGLHGEGQVVGIADVGISADSCFFSGDKIIAQKVLYTPTHSHVHGTHTAGSIAGDQLHNGLEDRNDGMAPAARLFVQDAGTPATGEMQVPADLGSLLQPAYDAGARIHSDSWGGSSRGYGVKERALDAFVASHPDMLVVLAAGNLGQPGSVASPTTAKNVLVVGALSSLAPDSVAAFSSRGPTQDGRIRPHLVAPGVGVVSAKADSSCDTTVLTGTSMAAPIAAGAAALARQYFVDGFYPSGQKTVANRLMPSAALLKATLLAGAEPMLDANPDGVLPAPDQGYGRLHLDGALPFGASGPRLWVLDDPTGIGPQDTYTTQLTLTGGALRLALAWTDPPAAEGSSSPLVDDLDLELEGPAGPDSQIRWGNAGDFIGGPQSAADHLNNEEVLKVAQLPAGTYTLRVRGWDVPMGPQSFALVAVGNLAAPVPAGAYTDAHNRPLDRHASAAAGCQAAPGDLGALLVVATVAVWGRRRALRTMSAK